MFPVLRTLGCYHLHSCSEGYFHTKVMIFVFIFISQSIDQISAHQKQRCDLRSGPHHPSSLITPPPPRLQTATCCSEKGRPWPAYFLSCDSDEDWCHTLEKRSLGRTPRVEVSNRTQQTKGGLKCHLSGQGFSGGGVEWDSKCVVWASETGNFRNSFYTRQQV